MWHVLRRPRWLGYLALAVLFGVVTAGLGSWQWHRHETKVERRAVVEANYGGDAVPLDEALPVQESLRPDQRWTRVTATGTYDIPEQHLVRNRPHEGVYGYEVLLPLRLDDGTVLAVDRGWVPNARTAADLPEVPEAPSGEVTVTGWLLPSEPDLGLDPVEGQLGSVTLEGLARATGLQPRGAYLVLESEDPPAASRPAQLEAPDTGLGSHLAYALQWWLTIPVGVILVLVMARREAQDEGLVLAAPAGRPDRPPRQKKVRIWDEEDA
ncbi:Cytochrome oxidase biogenesis protein Surf1, facilitates heme A insertion [Serinicoccus hydrothermalis]|uniref:SURF1-like protein n=1 Tax=Serinicoccus hydrothermalis TaxID=1758689 RepID=A0A1B1N8B9_9MICO|nr:SURF1 family protein [Serinicoccus hydrothermalis]ANS77671.1 Cytochrome oxidase biogenesis protein Surf1, facilitates heme A insertion [Serinicoccus hydrothermalis]